MIMPEANMAIDVVMTGEEAQKKGSNKDARVCTWTAFLNGTWTRERPIRPGRYRIASMDGILVGEIVAVRDRAEPNRLVLSQEWASWFWSFPTPPPPQPVPRPENGVVTYRPIPPPPPLIARRVEAADEPEGPLEDGDISNIVQFRRTAKRPR
jgi:hypothetical protein